MIAVSHSFFKVFVVMWSNLFVFLDDADFRKLVLQSCSAMLDSAPFFMMPGCSCYL